MMMSSPGELMRISTLPVCLEGLKLAAEFRARLDCLTIPPRTNVIAILMAGPSTPWLVQRVQSLLSRMGMMRRHCCEGVRIVRSAALRSMVMGKLEREVQFKASCLWINLNPPIQILTKWNEVNLDERYVM